MHYTQAGKRERDLLFSVRLDRGPIGGEESGRRPSLLLRRGGGENGDIRAAVNQKGASLSMTENGESALTGRCRRERRDGSPPSLACTWTRTRSPAGMSPSQASKSWRNVSSRRSSPRPPIRSASWSAAVAAAAAATAGGTAPGTGCGVAGLTGEWMTILRL